MFRIDQMTLDDIPEVGRVERRCFTNPWPSSAYRRELRYLDSNYYVVLRSLPGIHAVPNGVDHAPSEITRRALTRLVHPFARTRHEEPVEGPHIAGFAGMWIMYDEAHITTIGTDPLYRGRGFGELLLAALFEEAVNRNAALVSLEVRVSNQIAQRLYQKWGMSTQGVRARYYTDNGEDAYIMWSQSLRDPHYLAQIDQLRAAIVERVGEHLLDSPIFSVDPAYEFPEAAP